MAGNLISSEATIKAIRSGDPRKRLTDGDGLYLLLFVKGGSHGWRPGARSIGTISKGMRAGAQRFVQGAAGL